MYPQAKQDFGEICKALCQIPEPLPFTAFYTNQTHAFTCRINIKETPDMTIEVLPASELQPNHDN